VWMLANVNRFDLYDRAAWLLRWSARASVNTSGRLGRRRAGRCFDLERVKKWVAEDAKAQI